MRRTSRLVALALVMACGGDAGTTVNSAPVAAVTLDPANLMLQVGQAFAITARAEDNIGRTLTGRTTTWSSSVMSVATVEPSGIVNAVGAGTSVITVTIEGVSKSATVTVIPHVRRISVSPPTATVEVGSNVQLALALFDDNENAILTTPSVTWSSANDGTARVSATGLLTGVGVGTVVITATFSTTVATTMTATNTATVIPRVQVASVEILPNPMGLIEGQTRTLTAFARDGNGAAIVGRSFTWSTATPLLVTISQSGSVVGVAPGPAQVSATSDGVSGANAITVFSAATANGLGVGVGLEQFASIPAGLLNGGAVAAFRLQKTEVTRGQWQAVMGSVPAGNSGCATCPVSNVPFALAQQFVDALNVANPGAGFRIPTPVEWEYAARAGTVTQYPGLLELIAHYISTSDGHVWPVALRQANAFGLYDVIGNVAEWATSQSSRGGSWASTAFIAGSADPPSPFTPVTDVTQIGLRLARN